MSRSPGLQTFERPLRVARWSAIATGHTINFNLQVHFHELCSSISPDVFASEGIMSARVWFRLVSEPLT